MAEIVYRADEMAPALHGIERAHQAVAIAAGWPWCNTHRRSRCDDPSHRPPAQHHYLCPWPDDECHCHRFDHVPPSPIEQDALDLDSIEGAARAAERFPDTATESLLARHVLALVARVRAAEVSG